MALDLSANKDNILSQIKAWLNEDIGHGDMTSSSTIPDDHESSGLIHVKDVGRICGMQVAEWVFQALDPNITCTRLVEEGSDVENGQVLLKVEGNTRNILSGERLALNLLQRMSGIATNTARLSQKIADLPAKLCDTRKTTPGLRLLEKYAVGIGGGYNHRFGLFDAVMIKDNHIKAAGGVREAVQAARSYIPHTMKIEVEVEDRDQLQQAIASGVDIVMLDNTPPQQLPELVTFIRESAPHVLIEVSGGIQEGNIRSYAETGIDLISMGSLTSTIQPLDISLDLNEQKGAAL